MIEDDSEKIEEQVKQVIEVYNKHQNLFEPLISDSLYVLYHEQFKPQFISSDLLTKIIHGENQRYSNDLGKITKLIHDEYFRSEIWVLLLNLLFPFIIAMYHNVLDLVYEIFLILVKNNAYSMGSYMSRYDFLSEIESFYKKVLKNLIKIKKTADRKIPYKVHGRSFGRYPWINIMGTYVMFDSELKEDYKHLYMWWKNIQTLIEVVGEYLEKLKARKKELRKKIGKKWHGGIRALRLLHHEVYFELWSLLNSYKSKMDKPYINQIAVDFIVAAYPPSFYLTDKEIKSLAKKNWKLRREYIVKKIVNFK